MCDICHRTHCPPRCPNHGGGEEVYRCGLCGREAGEDAVMLLGGGAICSDCMAHIL